VLFDGSKVCDLMKIATYNILKGGAQRVHWVKMIEDHAVDLLLVQESHPHDKHLPALLYPNARKQSVWEGVEGNGWGSAVFSKSGSVKPVFVPGFAGWVIGAEIAGASWQRGGGDSLLAFSLHAPSRNQSYARQVNQILDEVARIASGRDVVIGGDFNLTVSHFAGSERAVSKQDLAIQSRLAEEFGLMNCWQTANPNQSLPQTLRWTRNRMIPYHCDGLFVPESWKSRLQSCVILSGDEWNALSDHNPVLAAFANSST
jgi:endonuclease/exonuclease/phosphatase family metal-dependent hydrolase